MTSENTASEKAAKATAVPRVVGAPPVTEVDENPKAGPGQKVVTSPTGTKSVVDEEAVDLLKTQGYKV